MMIDEKTFNKIASIVLMGVLVLLTFLILRPILISCLFALILSFIFYPLHLRLCRLVKSKNLSAALICFVLLAIVIVPVILMIPLLVRQSFSIYSYIQSEEFLGPIGKFIENLFTSEEVSKNLIISLNNSTSYLTNYFLEQITGILMNSPVILLHLVIILLVFFFGLRDGDKLVAYIQSLSPLSKESEKKIFQQFKDITHSVIYGQIVIGVIQGILTGIALFIFGIPNAIVLTIIAVFMGVLPIIGPSLVWIPVSVYLIALGRPTAGILFFIYGFFVPSGVDNVLRPVIVGRKTKINSGVILVSMVGGLFVFGVLGLIIGPLVIAYLLLILESYRKTKDKKYQEIFIHKE
jgi:predicted PurR-regulated permease PerM